MMKPIFLLPISIFLFSCSHSKIKPSNGSQIRTPQNISVNNIFCEAKDGFGRKYNKILISSGEEVIMETYPRRSFHELTETCDFINLMNTFSKNQNVQLLINEVHLRQLKRDKPLSISNVFSNLVNVKSLIDLNYHPDKEFLNNNSIVFLNDEVVKFEGKNKGLQMYVNEEPIFFLKMKKKKAKENATILNLKVQMHDKTSDFLTFRIRSYSADNYDASGLVSTISKILFKK